MALTKKQKVQLLIFFIVSSLLGFFLFAVSLFDLGSKSSFYVMVPKEFKSILKERQSVSYNGLDVGYITKIDQSGKDSLLLTVSLAIENEFPVNCDMSLIMLRNRPQHLMLQGGTPESKALQEGDTIPFVGLEKNTFQEFNGRMINSLKRFEYQQ